MNKVTWLSVVAGLMFVSRAGAAGTTFEDEVTLMKKHVDVVVLTDRAGAAQVAVVPAYQGRVMTSTAGGPGGLSYGWVNRELIEAGKVQPHINVFGGEDRFWIGPEGGQFSVFFGKNVPFDLEHWFTPAAIDTEPFEVVSKNAHQAEFRRRFALSNYSGTAFDVEVTRIVRLLERDQVERHLDVRVPRSVKLVAYETDNTLRNAGKEPWRKETGLLSIWMLGMYNATPDTTVVLPFQKGSETDRGPIVNDTYFGKVPADRLAVKDGAIFFKADANHRGKIGLSPRRAKNVLGSYDATHGVLTIVQYTQPAGATDYVNSMWELQKNPFGGDVVNSYNDGPPAPGAKQLGRFYELESSSPALALAPGAKATHIHRTIHLQGPANELTKIARSVLGVTVEEISRTLAR
jgi:hypothetical protein